MTKTVRSQSVNKKDLTDKLAARAKISKTHAAEYINIITKIISEALVDGKKVTISDFGTFNLSERDAFEGYDPKNKIRIQIPRRIIPIFRAGKQLKTSLNIPSIRRCILKGPRQLEIEFSKPMDPEDTNILSPKNYTITYTDGSKCTITGIKSGRVQTIDRPKTGNVQGIESIIVNLQQKIVSVDYVVTINAKVKDIDGNIANAPIIWSNTHVY